MPHNKPYYARHPMKLKKILLLDAATILPFILIVAIMVRDIGIALMATAPLTILLIIFSDQFRERKGGHWVFQVRPMFGDLRVGPYGATDFYDPSRWEYVIPREVN
jgi:hypothetical protein